MKDFSTIPPTRKWGWWRAVKWLLTIGLVLFGSHAVIKFGAEAFLRKKLIEFAATGCAVPDEREPFVVQVDPLAGDVNILGLALLPDPRCDSASAFRMEGRLDTLRISGLSLTRLLFSQTVSMDGLLLRVTRPSLAFSNDSLDAHLPAEVASEPWDLLIGSLSVQIGPGRVITTASDTITATGQGLHLFGNDLHYEWNAQLSRSDLRAERLRCSTDSFALHFGNGYHLSFAELALDQDQGTLEVYGASVVQPQGQEQYSATLRYETDVIEARIDTLQIDGMDLSLGLADRVWSARRLSIPSGSITVLRDKTLPDGPYTFQPLLARLVRKFPLGSGIDTITLSNMDIRYRERADPSRGFAMIPFTGVSGSISGLRNVESDSAELFVRARCTSFKSTPVSLVLRSAVRDTMDRFSVYAVIGRLPFADLNPATGPLVDVRATQGVMDSLVYRMNADNRRASGKVIMSYDGLKVQSGGRQRKQAMERVKTVLLNSFVRDADNKDLSYRVGEFSFERRKDRAVTNYLWSGLREGVKTVLLPDLKEN